MIPSREGDKGGGYLYLFLAQKELKIPFKNYLLQGLG